VSQLAYLSNLVLLSLYTHASVRFLLWHTWWNL